MTLLLVATFLRVLGLSDQGLVDWDAAYYIGVVKTIRVGLDGAWAQLIHGASAAILPQHLLEEGVAVNTTAKPGLILILLLGSFLFGISERLSLAISALAGLATIVLIGRIATLMFDRRVGVLSMFLLTFSFFHIHYSRSGLPVSVPTLFVYLAWLFYLVSVRSLPTQSPGHNREVFLSGLATGYAFSCHYNLFWVPPVFCALFLLEADHSKNLSVRGAGPWQRRFVSFASGAVLPLLFFEGVSRLVKWYIYRSPALIEAVRGRWGEGRFLTYFEDLRYQTIGRGYSFSGQDLPFYVRLIMQWEGSLVLFAFLIASIWAILHLKRDRSAAFLSCVALAVVPIVTWSSFQYPVARTVGVAIPAASILLAAWGHAVYERARHRYGAAARNVGVVVIGMIALGGWWHAQPILSIRSGMPAAIHFMKQKGSVKHLSSEFPLSRLSVGRSNVLDTTVSFFGKDTRQVISSYHDEGYQFLLISAGGVTSDPNLLKMLEGIEPIFRTPHSFHLTSYEYFDQRREAQRKILSAREEIQIYAIRDVLKKDHGRP